jgi:hypothetical protein
MTSRFRRSDFASAHEAGILCKQSGETRLLDSDFLARVGAAYVNAASRT